MMARTRGAQVVHVVVKHNPGSRPSSVESTSSSKHEEQKLEDETLLNSSSSFVKCIVCQERAATQIAVPCGHLHYCASCIQYMNHCGICRRKIDTLYTLEKPLFQTTCTECNVGTKNMYSIICHHVSHCQTCHERRERASTDDIVCLECQTPSPVWHAVFL
jgi:hypothetical protein